jgi:hypothetical protein
MLAEKVEFYQRELLRALGPIRVAVKFASDHSTITGGSPSEIGEALEALEIFADRLGRVVNGLRRLEDAT